MSVDCKAMGIPNLRRVDAGVPVSSTLKRTRLDRDVAVESAPLAPRGEGRGGGLWRAALVLATLVSCAPVAHPTSPAPDDEPIVIGAFLPLTGDDAAFGAAAREGMELALAEVNAGGGVHGRKLSLVFADDASTDAQAMAMANDLIVTKHAVALVGEVGLPRTLAAAIAADARKVPLVVPSATALEVTHGSDYVFRACFNDAQQAAAAARLAKERLGRTKAVLLRRTNDVGAQAQAAVFSEAFRKLGGAVIVDVPFGAGEEERAIAKVKAAEPDVIFAPVPYTEMPAMAAAASAAGLAGSLFLGTDAWDSSELAAKAGAALEGARFITHFFVDAPDAKRFAQAFQAKTGHAATSVAALSYDAVHLLADAAARAEGPEPGPIREALLATRDARGATGALSWVSSHEPRKPAYVVEIKDGALHFSETLLP